MKQYELTRLEKDTLHRIQLCIAGAKQMTDMILRNILDEVRPPKDSSPRDFHYRTVESYVNNWYHFIGQWCWPLASYSRKASATIAHDLVVAALGKDPVAHTTTSYNDTDMVFTTKAPIQFEDVELQYFAEVRPKDGRKSLFPAIYRIGQFGEITEEEAKEYDIDISNSKIVYAYAETVKNTDE